MSVRVTSRLTRTRPRRRLQEEARQDISVQYEQIDQQNESYIVGMWSFLVTEIMFFGGLFLAYTIYRARYPAIFNEVSQLLDWKLGFLNTLILLSSSLSMAFAVRNAQLAKRGATIRCLLITILFAFGFLVVKTVEYTNKYQHHHIPGASFSYGADESALIRAKPATADNVQQQAQLFLSLYFAMTGLHGVHVIIGILMLGALALMYAARSKIVEDYMTTEMIGLYWHFVDIVWIFLYPLLYLIHPQLTGGGGGH